MRHVTAEINQPTPDNSDNPYTSVQPVANDEDEYRTLTNESPYTGLYSASDGDEQDAFPADKCLHRPTIRQCEGSRIEHSVLKTSIFQKGLK